MRIDYRLFAEKPTEEALLAAEKERFARITEGYVLFYTSGVGRGHELSAGDLGAMTDQDREWLAAANRQILFETYLSNEQKAAQKAGEFLAVFEEELEKTRDEQDQKGHTV